MSDVTERLRAGVCAESTGCLPTQCACDWMDQAADEIERLRALLRQIDREVSHGMLGDYFIALNEIRREVRAALGDQP